MSLSIVTYQNTTIYIRLFYNKAHMILLTIFNLLCINNFNKYLELFLFLGEMSVFYLFTRYRFNWSEVQFSFFSTYAMLTSLIGKYELK